jgi:hypothetical protein
VCEHVINTFLRGRRTGCSTLRGDTHASFESNFAPDWIRRSKQAGQAIRVTGIFMLIGLVYWVVVIWPQNGKARNLCDLATELEGLEPEGPCPRPGRHIEVPVKMP